MQTEESAPAASRWLVTVTQLPTEDPAGRMRMLRTLESLGAAVMREGVYVLPDTPDTREDLEWLKTEIKSAHGDASVFAARNVDSWSDDALVEEFRRARQDAYGSLARDIERLLGRLEATRRPRGARAPAVRRLVEVFRERLSAIERVDFFGSAGRDRVVVGRAGS